MKTGSVDAAASGPRTPSGKFDWQAVHVPRQGDRQISVSTVVAGSPELRSPQRQQLGMRSTSIASRRGFELASPPALAASPKLQSPPLSPRSVRFVCQDDYLDSPKNIQASTQRNAPSTAYLTKRALDRLCRDISGYTTQAQVARTPQLLIEFSALYTYAVSQAIAFGKLDAANESSLNLGVALRALADKFRNELEQNHVDLPTHLENEFASAVRMLDAGFDIPDRPAQFGPQFTHARKTSARQVMLQKQATVTAALQRSSTSLAPDPASDPSGVAVPGAGPYQGGSQKRPLQRSTSVFDGMLIPPVRPTAQDAPETLSVPDSGLSDAGTRTMKPGAEAESFMPPESLIRALEQLQILRLREVDELPQRTEASAVGDVRDGPDGRGLRQTRGRHVAQAMHETRVRLPDRLSSPRSARRSRKASAALDASAPSGTPASVQWLIRSRKRPRHETERAEEQSMAGPGHRSPKISRTEKQKSPGARSMDTRADVLSPPGKKPA
jgi:hypothetical protein